MWKWGANILGLGTFIFAAFSSSTSYSLNSYAVGPGAVSNTSSSTYHAQATVGEQANGVANSATYSGRSGSVQAEQLSVPLAPTLSNGSGTYYNMLNCVIVTTHEPSDATYAIAVSTNNFSTTLGYVQSTGAIGGSPVYQSYTSWGGSSGTPITGLAESTSYEVRVAAKEGLFTNTEFGAYTTASTVGATISFSVSPNSYSFGNILSGTIYTSSNAAFTFSTNGASGGEVYVEGKDTGFYSAIKSYTIPAYSGNLSGQTQGFGIQATNPTQTSGGPLTTVSPFNGTGNTIGAESTTFQPIFSSAAAISGGTADANVQIKASTTAPPSNDYTEVFTFIASASF